MDQLRSHHSLFMTIIGVTLINILLYSTMLFFHERVLFQKDNYINHFHVYIEDPRIFNKPFNLLKSLAQADSQWYIKIAEKGYPKHPTNINMRDKRVMDGLSYAYFPLYPLILRSLNQIAPNILLYGFLLSNILIIANVISLFYYLRRVSSSSLAVKTIFLLFSFPLGIFYRSYFTEGLFLFLSIWFCYFLMQKQFTKSAFFLSLLLITKGNALLLILVYFYSFIRVTRTLPHFRRKLTIPALLIFTPLLGWVFYNFFQTGDPFYFYNIQKAWNPYGILSLFYNLLVVSFFFSLKFHHFSNSQLEVLTFIITLFLLWKSRKYLPEQLWLFSLCLWITPLISHDLSSFTRYQSVSFPLFFYIAQKLRGKYYKIAFTFFLSTALIVSLFFINWYWVG